MRTLSDTLLEYQKKPNLKPLFKIVVDGTTYDKSRIIDIEHDESPWSQKATVILNNSDKALNDVDYKGLEAIISYGLITSVGEEYQATDPLTVIGQELYSKGGQLICELILEGIPNALADEQASETYAPVDGDDGYTDAVYELIDNILDASLDCYNHCTEYDVIRGTIDSLMSSFKPKDDFRIYEKGNRLAALRKLLDFTGCVMRYTDGDIHIFKPITTGTTYDVVYSLGPGNHNFFTKAYQKRLVIPNKVVVRSNIQDDDEFEGTATDPSYSDLLKQEFYRATLEDDDQANDMAEAIIKKAQIAAKGGSGEIPLDLGLEVYDYVRITDTLQGDYVKGNVGWIHRRVNLLKKEWKMTFGFGGWTSTKGLLKDLTVDTDVGQLFERLSVKDLYAENIQTTQLDINWIDPEGNLDFEECGDTLDNLPDGEYYSRKKSLRLDGENGLQMASDTRYYIRYDPASPACPIIKSTSAPEPEENLYWVDISEDPPVVKKWSGSSWVTQTAEQVAELNRGIFIREVKYASLSDDGLILLDKVYVDDVEGEYALVSRTDMSAGHIKLSVCVEDEDHRLMSDADKLIWDNKPENMDEIDVGVTYSKILKSDLSTEIETEGHIKLTSYTYKDGVWYDESYVKIDSSGGITLRRNHSQLTTQDLSFEYTDADEVTSEVGYIYPADDTLAIWGKHNLRLITSANGGVSIHAGSTTAPTANDLRLSAEEDMYIYADNDINMEVTNGDINLMTGGGKINVQGYLYAGLNNIYTAGHFIGDVGTFNDKSTVYCSGLSACPMPANLNSLDIIRSMKDPSENIQGHFGTGYKYFSIEDFPEEMKAEFKSKDKDGKETIVKDIEIIRTVGVLVQSVRELTAKVDALENKTEVK